MPLTWRKKRPWVAHFFSPFSPPPPESLYLGKSSSKIFLLLTFFLTFFSNSSSPRGALGPIFMTIIRAPIGSVDPSACRQICSSSPRAHLPRGVHGNSCLLRTFTEFHASFERSRNFMPPSNAHEISCLLRTFTNESPQPHRIACKS
jgi:hypothetical protein